MKPFTLTVVAAAAVLGTLGACHHKADPVKPGDGSGGDSGPAILAKRVQVSWGIQQAPTSADVYLQTTDETGAQVSHALGTFPGQCTAVLPAAPMNALIAVDCLDGARGLELQVTAQQGHITVLRMHVDQGVTPDPMAREEVTSFSVPPGAGVQAHP